MRRACKVFWLVGCFSIFLALIHAQGQAPDPSAGWPTYGGDPGGQRYSPADQINPGDVAQLQKRWEYHTGALATPVAARREAAFEATPVLAGRSLYFSTPFDQVISLDAASGQERWRFDPKLAADVSAGVFTSRGVAFWSSGQAGPACAERIFLATLDARLIALDASSGAPCGDFGGSGTVNLRHGVPTQKRYPYQEFGVSSPPTVVGDVVVVGSAVADGQEVDVEPGLVRGYDVRSGRLLWTWDPLPWARQQKVRTGAGNTWGVIAADPARHLIFLPTGSASPDFYGGMRPGDDRDADSVVALDARTGKKVWAFQLVHHDLWDYDVAAEPLLFEFQNRVPAIAISTKMGMIFVLNRLTGVPLFPVVERPVPQSDVPGEKTAPTQPFSSLPALSPLQLQPQDLRAQSLPLRDPEASREPGAQKDPGAQRQAHREACAAAFRSLRNEGIYTPPSLQGSLLYPGSLGGVNWGSAAFDPATGVLYVNSNHQAFRTRLVRRWAFEADDLLGSWENWIYAAVALLVVASLVRRRPHPGWVSGTAALLLAIWGGAVALRPAQQQHFGREIAPQRKSPYAVERSPIEDNAGLPCTPTPWGKMTAMNLNTGVKVWEEPLGTMVPGAHTGSLNLGGPIVTAGGLVFDAATREPVLRAFDKATGNTLWTGTLPAPAQSTPMTYVLDGTQFVVIAAGGHGGFGTTLGDSLVAFALPSH